MIWIWIAAAILITLFLLRRKNISIENYIWVLLPVDMYGVNLAGVTIKPYMAFSLILLIGVFVKKRGKLFIGNNSQAIIILFLFGALIVNLFNGGNTSSIMSILMVLMVYFCACLYVSNIDETIDEIPDVIVATSIGYGLVFIAAYLSSLAGMNLPRLTTTVRSEPGILMKFSNMLGGNLISNYRLRGFNIDPNTSVGVFLAAFSIDLMTLMSEGRKEKSRLVSFVICLACIILTNSRMGIVAAIIVLLFSGSYAVKKMDGRQKQKTIIGLLFLGLIFIAALVFTGIGDKAIASLASIYGNRSGFSDEYGRGSIWKEAISIWVNRGFFFGIGTAQMQFATSTGRACHNTWLEWLCSCGIIVGSSIVLYFFGLLAKGFRRRVNVTEEDRILYQALLMGLFGMIWCLLTVDNITNSYLWFFALTMIKGMSILNDRYVDTEYAVAQGN